MRTVSYKHKSAQTLHLKTNHRYVVKLLRKSAIVIAEFVEVIADGSGFVEGPSDPSAELNASFAREKTRDGVYRQYVNLPRDLAGETHPDYGREIHLRARVQWVEGREGDSLVGKKLTFRAESPAIRGRPEHNGAADGTPGTGPANGLKAGFGSPEGKMTIDVTVDDEDGYTAPQPFHTSIYGGDRFSFTADVSAAEKVDAIAYVPFKVGTYEVWRRAWMQVTHTKPTNGATPAEPAREGSPAEADVVPDLAPFFDAYRRVFIDVVRTPDVTFARETVDLPNVTYYPEYMVKKKGGRRPVVVIGSENSEGFKGKLVASDKEPLKLHAIICDYQIDDADYSEEHTFKLHQQMTPSLAISIPGDVILKPPVKGNLLNHNAAWRSLKGEKQGKLTADDVIIDPDRKAPNRVGIRLPDTLAPEDYPVEVKFKVRSGASYAGESLGKGHVLSVYQRGKARNFNDTLVHEVGHALYQVAKPRETTPRGKADHALWHDDAHGGTGDHCRRGCVLLPVPKSISRQKVTLIWVPGKVLGRNICVMFWGTFDSGCMGHFCEECEPSLRLQTLELSDILGKKMLTGVQETEEPWLQIELIDSRGEPARGKPFVIEKADGEVFAQGFLDDNGRAAYWKSDFPELASLDEYQVVFPVTMAEEEAKLPGNNWMAIELLGGRGEPAAGWRYELYTPGGTFVEDGTLDHRGRASVVQWKGGGQYQVAFFPPSRETLAQEEAKPTESNWLAIELLDGRGEPAAGWRYELYAPGGTFVDDGTLDHRGKASVVQWDGGGEYQVAFLPPPSG